MKVTKSQKNIFSNMMDSWTKSTQLYNQALDSNGFAQERQEMHIQSISGKIAILGAEITTLWQSMISSDALKFFVDLGISSAKAINAIGGLAPILRTILGLLIVLKAQAIGLAFTKIISNLGGMGTALKLLKSNILGYISAMQGVSSVTTMASVSMTTLATGGIGLVVMAFAAVSMGISAYNKHQQKLIDNSNEAIESFRNLNNEVKSNISTLQSFSGEFETLSKGVDKNGKNVSLSADEYARYNEIVNKLVELNPSIIQGYTDENNAIISKNTSLKEQIDLERERLDLAKRQTADKFSDSYGARLNAIDKQKSSSESLKEELEGEKQNIRFIISDYAKTIAGEGINLNDLLSVKDFNGDEIKNKISQLMKEVSSTTDEQQRNTLNNTIVFLQGMYNKYETATQGINGKIRNIDTEWKMSMDRMVADTKYAVTSILDDDMKKMPEEMKNIAQGIIESLDFSQIKDSQDLFPLAAQVTNSIDLIQKYGNEFKYMGRSVEDATDLSARYQAIAEKEGVAVGEVSKAMAVYRQYLSGVTIEQEKVSSATKTTEEAMEALQKTFDDTASSIEALSKMQKELTDDSRLSAKSMTEIVKNYPELIQYLGDEIALKEALIKKIDEERVAQQEAYNQILMATDNYYQQKMLADTQWVNSVNKNISSLYSSLGVAYKDDVSNYKNAEMAKAGITEKLINSLGEAWAKYFNSTTGALKTQSEFSAGGNGYSGADYAKIAQVQNTIDGITKQFDSFKFDPISIDIGGVKPSKEKSGGSSKKDQYYSDNTDALIADILSSGDKIAEAIELKNSKLEVAITKGDLAEQDILESDISKLMEQQLLNTQNQAQNITKIRDGLIKELASKNISFLKGVNLNNLTEKQIADIEIAYDKAIDKANDKQANSLSNQKSLVMDYFNNIKKTNESLADLSNKYWAQNEANLEKAIQKIDKAYDKIARKIDVAKKISDIKMINVEENTPEWAGLIKEQYDSIIATRENAEKAMRELRKKGLSEDSEDIQKYNDIFLNAESERFSLIKSLQTKQKDLQKQIDDARKNAEKDIQNALIDIMKDGADKRKKQLEKELKAITDAIDDALQRLDRAESTRDFDMEQTDQTNAILETEYEIAKYKQAALDGDREAQVKVAELEKKLAEQKKTLVELQHDREVDLRKDNLNDAKDSAEKETAYKKEQIDTQLDNQIRMLEQSTDLLNMTTEEMKGILGEFFDGIGVNAEEFYYKLGTITDKFAEIAKLTQELSTLQSSFGDSMLGDYEKDIRVPNMGESDNTNSTSSNAPSKITEAEAKKKAQINEQGYLHSLAVKAKAENNTNSIKYIENLRSSWGLDKNGGIIGDISSSAWDSVKSKYGFSKGGKTSATGLHWLDGEMGKPEEVLSADMTKDFRQLLANAEGFNKNMTMLQPWLSTPKITPVQKTSSPVFKIEGGLLNISSGVVDMNTLPSIEKCINGAVKKMGELMQPSRGTSFSNSYS